MSRTKVTIAADGLSATIDSGVYVYSARVAWSVSALLREGGFYDR